MRPVRIVLVEDNDVFREALELLLGMRDDVEVVAAVGDGGAAVAAAIEYRPDVVLMDYRMPGHGRRGGDDAGPRVAPEVAVVALTASANARRARGARRGGRGERACGRTRSSTRSSPRSCMPQLPPPVNLTAANTAIVLDSTADLPDAADRFPNWRVVPLYVRFGDESFRDGVDIDADRVLRAPARVDASFPTTSQPTPGDFLSCYGELAGYERIFSLHLSARVSGTFESAGAAAAELGDGRVRPIDTETASAAIAMLALAIQRRLERGTTDEEIDALIERYRREQRPALHGRHARVPRARRPDRQGGGVRRRRCCTSSRSSRSATARSCR